MKKLLPIILLAQLLACSQQPVTHVVLFWLKDPSNVAHKQQIVDKTQAFVRIPGVLSLHVGPEPKTREAIDATGFDLALTIEFPSTDALGAYIANPIHRRVNGEVGALITELKVYDFEHN